MIDTLISCSPLRWDAWDIITDMHADLDASGDGDNHERREKFILRDDDPLNIHQATMRHLQKNTRHYIENVESLCRVILSSAMSSFDYTETPEGYHFFDFFENRIGDVVRIVHSRQLE